MATGKMSDDQLVSTLSPVSSVDRSSANRTSVINRAIQFCSNESESQIGDNETLREREGEATGDLTSKTGLSDFVTNLSSFRIILQ